MFRSINNWMGYGIQATDGDIGEIHDFYFDDNQWSIRYIIIDIGPWIKDRKVILSPDEFIALDSSEQYFSLKKLNKGQIKNSPEIDTALPVSKQEQISLHKYYRWPPYAISPITTEVKETEDSKEVEEAEAVSQMQQNYSELRSAREVIRYSVKGKDGELGKVEDLLVDDEAWKIVYLVIDSKEELEIDKKILVTMSWIKWMHHNEQEIYLDLNKQTVRNSPSYDPERPKQWPMERELHKNTKKPYLWVLK